jgi:hypothetical protein
VSATHVRWSASSLEPTPAGSGRGEAEVTVLDGDRITVLSTSAWAPGARPEGALPSGALLRLKVARCRRQEAGFLIEGRVLGITREARAEVERLLVPGQG